MSNVTPGNVDFIADFSIDSDYNEQAAYDRVQFAANSPVIHAEVNEFSQILNGKMLHVIDDTFTDGTFETGNTVYEGGVLSISGMRLKFSGHIYVLDEVSITCNEGNTIYFGAWETTYMGSSRIGKWGYVKGTAVPNNIFYSGWDDDKETTRRKAWVYDVDVNPPTDSTASIAIGIIQDGAFVKTVPGVAHKLGWRLPYGWLRTNSVNYTTEIDGYPEYHDGQLYIFIPEIPCGDNPTVNVNGAGQIYLQTTDGINLKAGDLLAQGAYVFLYMDTGSTAPSFRLIGTAYMSGYPVRPHTHATSDLPIRSFAATLTQSNWIASTAPDGTPLVGQNIYIQNIPIPSIIASTTGNPMGVYFETNPTDTDASALINYVAVADRFLVFHATEIPIKDLSINSIQLIGGMLGTYTNPVTPSAYPSPVTGHGFGNLGGMPWFSTFFSKLPAITGTFYTGNVDPTGSGPRMNYNGDFKAYRVSSVVWNDYAEARECDFPLVAGSVVVEVGNDKVMPSHRRLIPGAQIVSDTYGMLLGNVSNKEYPIAVSGRVLTHVEGDRSSYSVGDCVCSAPNGCISKMTREEIREYPEAIIGTVSSVPTYLIWENKVLVDNRIWIKLR